MIAPFYIIKSLFVFYGVNVIIIMSEIMSFISFLGDSQILTEANEEGKNKKGLAEAAHINVSRVLQEALISKLNINKIV